jgi:hypothetical protein
MLKKTRVANRIAAAGGAEMANKIALTIVVQGKPVPLEAEPNAPLHSLIGHALAESGNIGQPDVNWEFRDAAGALLDSNAKVEDLKLAPGTTLFLNLKAGVGG